MRTASRRWLPIDLAKHIKTGKLALGPTEHGPIRRRRSLAGIEAIPKESVVKILHERRRRRRSRAERRLLDRSWPPTRRRWSPVRIDRPTIRASFSTPAPGSTTGLGVWLRFGGRWRHSPSCSGLPPPSRRRIRIQSALRIGPKVPTRRGFFFIIVVVVVIELIIEIIVVKLVIPFVILLLLAIIASSAVSRWNNRRCRTSRRHRFALLTVDIFFEGYGS